jgi:hypothetical protein
MEVKRFGKNPIQSKLGHVQTRKVEISLFKTFLFIHILQVEIAA